MDGLAFVCPSVSDDHSSLLIRSVHSLLVYTSSRTRRGALLLATKLLQSAEPPWSDLSSAAPSVVPTRKRQYSDSSLRASEPMGR